MRLTNNTSLTLDFLKKDGAVKDGVPETVSIAPGVTADLAVNESDPQVHAAIFSGALSAAQNDPQPARQAPNPPSTEAH